MKKHGRKCLFILIVCCVVLFFCTACPRIEVIENFIGTGQEEDTSSLYDF
jgi:hypothetical protein